MVEGGEAVESGGVFEEPCLALGSVDAELCFDGVELLESGGQFLFDRSAGGSPDLSGLIDFDSSLIDEDVGLHSGTATLEPPKTNSAGQRVSFQNPYLTSSFVGGGSGI